MESSSAWAVDAREAAKTMSHEALCTWLESKTEQMRQDLRGIIAFRNTLSPVSHLPHEIVVEIILWVRKLAIECDVVSWLHATQFCHHWREVALSAPVLWTRIWSDNPKLLQLFLRRSDDSKLNVNPDGCSFYYHLDEKMPSNAEQLCYDAERISRLYSHTVETFRKALRYVRFEALEVLDVGDIRDWESREEDADINVGCAIDQDCRHRGYFPHLRKLFFMSAKLDLLPGKPWFPSLVHLELRYIDQESLAPLLKVFKSMPVLEFLSIEECDRRMAHRHSVRDAQNRVVSFPKLRRLHLVDPLSIVSLLLSHMAFPIGVVATIAISDDQRLLATPLPLDRNTIPISPLISNICLSYYGDNTVQVQALFRSEVVVAESALLRLYCHAEKINIESQPETLREILDILSLSPVATLQLYTDEDDLLKVQDLLVVLSRFPQLENIAIFVWDIEAFCAVLDNSIEALELDPLCPKLRSITVFSAPTLGDSDSYYNKPSLHAIPSLTNTLKARRSRGSSLDRISFERFRGEFVSLFDGHDDALAELRATVAILDIVS